MRGRFLRVASVVIGGLVVGTSVAFATGAIQSVVGSDGSIQGCYKAGNGQLRVVGSADGCNDSELPISWNQTGTQGPIGPAGPKGDQGPAGETVKGFRVGRLTPDEVAITAVGAGPLGFDFPGGGPTTVLAMALPQGVYALNSSIAARKDSGAGDFICWVEDGTFAGLITRTSLGADSGHSRRATVASNGIFSIPAGGGTLTMACWQAANAALPGTPTGENPTVFYATLSATSLTRATLTRFPSGVVRELP